MNNSDVVCARNCGHSQIRSIHTHHTGTVPDFNTLTLNFKFCVISILGNARDAVLYY